MFWVCALGAKVWLVSAVLPREARTCPSIRTLEQFLTRLLTHSTPSNGRPPRGCSLRTPKGVMLARLWIRTPRRWASPSPASTTKTPMGRLNPSEDSPAFADSEVVMPRSLHNNAMRRPPVGFLETRIDTHFTSQQCYWARPVLSNRIICPSHCCLRATSRS